MMRLVLYAVLAWLAAKVVGLLFRSMTQPRPPQQKRENNFADKKPNSQMEFKDVQDAVFTEVNEKEKAAQ